MKFILLIEIGTEELPSKELWKLAQSFFKNVCFELNLSNILYQEILWFASFRRLAVQVTVLIDPLIWNLFRNNETPGIIQAFNIKKNSSPFVVMEEWAKFYGVPIISNNCFIIYKKQWLFYRPIVHDRTVNDLLCKIVNNSLRKMSNYSLMKWSSNGFMFIRPIRSITILLDEKLILGTVYNIDIDRIVLGHRFMGEYKVVINHAHDYLYVLMKQGYVIADFYTRKRIIQVNVEKEVKKIGGHINENDRLLEENTALVEWPVILVGKFDKNFLKLPREVLIDVIENEQKCFVVINSHGILLSYFVFVINIQSINQEKIVIDNERVMHSKLMDALYFFNTDYHLRLEDYYSRLNTVLFHKQLGTLHDKSQRLEYLSSWIAKDIGLDVQKVVRAAHLSKCDLLSNMVIEFPRVQGIIGMYYARRDGESELVALAQKEHYYPRFSNDVLPTTKVSCILAISDRIDNISGMFCIGEYPKGSRDPFALRRAAVGILRIIIEQKISLNFFVLIEKSVLLYKGTFFIEGVVKKISDFVYKRLCVFYVKKGYKISIIQAILKNKLINILDFDCRIRAIHNFCRVDNDVLSLKLVIKRVYNILNKFNQDNEYEIQFSFFKIIEEIKLFDKLIALDNHMKYMINNRCYLDILKELLQFSKLVNVFLDSAMVLSKDRNIRLNRLALLKKSYRLLVSVIDFSLLD